MFNVEQLTEVSNVVKLPRDAVCSFGYRLSPQIVKWSSSAHDCWPKLTEKMEWKIIKFNRDSSW